MLSIIMNSKAAQSIRERMMMNYTVNERKTAKSYISPLELYNASREYNGIDYCNVFGVLMPR